MFSLSLSLGHHGDASQHLLAPGSPCLLAGSRRWKGREGGREAAGAQPYLDGRFLAGLLGFLSLQSPPFSFFPLPLVCLPASCAPLSPPFRPSGLLRARATRDSTGKG